MCYSSRTPRLPPAGTIDTMGAPDFTALGCRIVGRTKTLCAPVDLSGVPAQSFTAPALTRWYTCWALRCSDVPPAAHETVDRFGNGEVDFPSGGTTELCVPAVLDECQGGSCGSYSGCHESGACSCFTGSRGQHFCAVPTPCADTTECKFGLQDTQQNGGGCPEGFVCIVGSCCGAAVCVPASSLCAAGDPPPPSPPHGTSTTAGVQP